MEKLLNQILDQMQKLTDTVTSFDSGQKKLVAQVSQLENGQQELVAKFNKLDGGQNALVSQVHKIEVGQKELTTRIDPIEHDIKEIKGLTSRIETKQHVILDHTVRLSEYHTELKIEMEDIKEHLLFNTHKITENERVMFKLRKQ
ncbi:hypothetical protein MKX47_07800 [Solibacillus sp. FSL R7-0668]|uniref:hypothetical protein n=1 Tax=Solibacillus sp. FSL R7-0668 TaxID=2921688 RepID=UPI0030F86EC8